jgi:hypothetical protein
MKRRLQRTFMQQPHKISFCTVCMNRLHHLRETLPANLEQNASYPSLEFVLLDYNSSDGLEDWVKTELKQFIDSGRLVYYRTTEPRYFHRSHSRNMAFNLASGDIICNVDADNFTGKYFARFINEQFTLNKNIFIAADTRNRYYFIRDVCGRICFWKKDFESLGGFDEQMEGYGDEDIDFINRLQRMERQEIVIRDMHYLHAILHSDLERIQHEHAIANLSEIYVSHCTPHSSHIRFLFSEGVFSAGTLIDKTAQASTQLPVFMGEPSLTPNDRYALQEHQWETGNWHRDGGTFHFMPGSRPEEAYRYENGMLIPATEESADAYFCITDQAMIIEAINFYSRMKNMVKLTENKICAVQSSQKNTIGKGTVVKNFNNEHVIII